MAKSRILVFVSIAAVAFFGIIFLGLIGYGIYKIYTIYKSITGRIPNIPEGGTILDIGYEKVTKANYDGSVWRSANTLGKALTCDQEYGIKSSDPKQRKIGFWDSVTGQCWSCPKGYTVNLLPKATDLNKCRKVAGLFQPKSEIKALGPHRSGKGLAGLTISKPGSVLISREYWECPSGTNKTIFNPTGPNRAKACKGTCKALYGNLSFERPLLSGECYSCPDRFERSNAEPNATNACRCKSNCK